MKKSHYKKLGDTHSNLKEDMENSSRIQDQPYSIQFSGLGIASSAAYIAVLVIISTTLVYFFVFIPLSYLNQSQIKTIWEFGIWLLWLVAFFSALVYFGLKYMSKNINRWIWRIAFYSNWVVWSIVYALSFLGLYPASDFVPLVAILTAAAFFLFEQIFSLTLKYNHYLSRSMSFAEQGSIFLALIAAFNLFLLFGQGFRSFLSRETLFTSSTIIFVFNLISLVIITYFAANIELNNPRSSRYKTISSLLICMAAVIANYIDTGFLSFWWLGMASLAPAVFYTAHSPTRQKSTVLALVLYSMLTLALILDAMTYRVSIETTWNIVKEFIFPAIGILATIVVAIPSFIKTLFPSLRSHQISGIDVIHGSQDIIDVDGFSVRALDQIMRIAIISMDFSYCEKLLAERRRFPSSELFEYFEIYYLCVQFTHARPVFVEKIVDDLDKQDVAITTQSDFSTYINNKFPQHVSNFNIWEGYFTKGYITIYLSEEKLSQSRPRTVYTQITTYVKNAFIILMILLSFSSQIIAPWMNVLPAVVAKAATWNSSRKNEIRLLLTSVAKPYQINDPDIRDYYAFSMWTWIQNREIYIGEKEDEHIYMPTEEIKTQLEYLETILSFYDKRDDFFFVVSNELGGYYKGLGDCKKAFTYFEKVLTSSISVERRDFAIAMSAKCFEEQDLPTALGLLEEAYQDVGYIQSRIVLAEIYYEQGRYRDTIELLNPIQSSLDAVTLSFLGESFYHESQYTNSIGILEAAISDNALAVHVDREIYSYLYLGSAFLETNDPFKAGEYYYKAFSGQICPALSILTTDEIKNHIPRYKSAIELVSKQNPSDFRTNLWKFVYFLYTGETEKAIEFFKIHINQSPEYEPDFSNCVLAMLKGK